MRRSGQTGSAAPAGVPARLAWAAAAALAALVALALAVPAGSAWADEATASNWEISKSKTATNLDNFESEVTLSLPSAEQQLATDVVFVLDESSCSAPVKAEVADMLGKLYAQIDKTDAVVKVGAVQFRGEVTELPLTELTANTKDDVAAFMSNRPATGGSNMSAGLLAGKAMLDDDKSVSYDRKYLILVSDGITYIWDDESTSAQENYGVNFANGDTPNAPMLASPDGWDVKYGNGYVPGDWANHMADVASMLDSTIADKASLYDRADPTADKPFVAYGEKDSYASTVDVALYKSWTAYQDISSAYPHTYAVTAGVDSETQVYPFGPSFMGYLANGKSADFSSILNDIIYLVDADSYVEDYMGYVADDYNFDFVNEAEALELTVGGEKYAVKQVDLPEGSEETARYLFTCDGVAAANEAEAPFVLHYYADSSEANPDEHFVWDINVPVTNFKAVQLTYKVKLTNPKTEAGTYGEYDEDGASGFDGLYTNNSATLYPVDSNGAEGAKELFLKPTVSYTVEKQQPVVTPTEPDDSVTPATPADDQPAGGKETVEFKDPAKLPAQKASLAQTGDPLSAAVPLVALVVVACAALGAFAWRKSR